MFDWLFKPSCPCDVHAKAWVEQRLQWLAMEFPDSAFSGRAVVLPTPEYFPEPYDGSHKSVRFLLDRCCEYMDVDPYQVDLELVETANKLWLVNRTGQYLPGAAGTYEAYDRQGDVAYISGTAGIGYEPGRSRIRIDKSELEQPMSLVGTLAHELAHVRLLGESRISPEVFDNELLTDLTVVHFGLGIFLANTPRVWASQISRWPNAAVRRPEYMNPPMFAWALAHLAWFREELPPPWAKYLRMGPQPTSNRRFGI